ncbi:MAG TPA: threonine-phosphate decarboxylase CobD [Gemmataceae bacterium]|nr:threonine-phosphate decarboxylase CobD [Gemmataceae bacterium]
MRKLPRRDLEGNALFQHGGRGLPGLERALDFSSNINPLGPPRRVLDALCRALPEVARYPDADCTALTHCLAAQHGVAPEQIVVGNGSTELIYATARACRPQRVAIAEPTFTEYLRASRLVGAAVDHWLAQGSQIDLEPFEPGNADLVWLCNPNNPTGRLWPPGSLPRWIRNQSATRFVVDEAFLPFLESEPEHSLVPLVHGSAKVIVLRSLTKLFALPGLRLGYAIAARPFADSIRAELPPWSVNRLAQIAGLAALDDHDFLARTRTWFRAERSSFHQALEGLSHHLQIIPSEANFFLLRLRQGSSAGLATALAEDGISIRDASNFVGLAAGDFRVAVRTAAENSRLVGALHSLLDEKGNRPWGVRS